MESKQGQFPWKTILKIIFTLAAFYWLSSKISFKEVFVVVKSSNYWFLFLALMCYALSQVIASSRLNSFFKGINLHISERYNLRLYQLGLLYNFFLPGGIGGDGYKIFFLKKRHPIKGRKILSAVFFDRLSGLWAIFIIVCLLIVMMPRLGIPNYIPLIGIFIGTITYFYLLNLFFKKFSKNWLVTHSKALFVQGFQILSVICILFALHFDGKFSPYLLIFLVSSVAAIIPSIGGGIGVRELVVLFSAQYIQLDEKLAVSVSLIFYLLSLLVASTGLYYLFRPQRLGTDKIPSIKQVENDLEKEN